MRILYAGTEEIAVPTLEALAAAKLVVAVLTTPDEPGKRGKTLLPSPVKQAAVRLGLPVLQCDHLGSEARKLVSAYAPDTLMSFCYGRIFGPKFLALFSRRFNIHPSLLPKYRGCAPIQAAILSLDRQTGISIQDIAPGIDEGDLYLTQSFSLDGSETSATLCDRVSRLASSLAVDLLGGLDVFRPRAQEGEASYTRMIAKDDGRLDFSWSAARLHATVRAYSTWPKAWCLLCGQRLLVTGVDGSAFDIADGECQEEPGTIVALDKAHGLKVATESGYLHITRLQLPTKKEMDSQSFVNGQRGIIGKRLE